MNKHDCSREEAKSKYVKCCYYSKHAYVYYYSKHVYYSKHAYVVWSKPLHGEVPYIAAFITESERKLTGNHYKWIFDPGANIIVICNDELVINIRTIEKQSANGIGGPATFTEA